MGKHREKHLFGRALVRTRAKIERKINVCGRALVRIRAKIEKKPFCKCSGRNKSENREKHFFGWILVRIRAKNRIKYPLWQGFGENKGINRAKHLLWHGIG